MDNLSAYLERLELIGFFSGFPLLYALILFIAGPEVNRSHFKQRMVRLLPYSYAVVGVAYWGFVLSNWYPDYSIANRWNEMQMPFLKCWALLSIIFFIPVLAKKPAFALIHSLPFFYLVIADLFWNDGNLHMVGNDMKLYTDSLLIQVASLFVISAIIMIYRRLSAPKRQLRH